MACSLEFVGNWPQLTVFHAVKCEPGPSSTVVIMRPVPDIQPGNYYVSAMDGTRYYLMYGPFPNDHAGALAWVDRCRVRAEALDPRAQWMAWGTCRVPFDQPAAIGKLNTHMTDTTI